MKQRTSGNGQPQSTLLLFLITLIMAYSFLADLSFAQKQTPKPGSDLLKTGNPSRSSTSKATPAEIKIVSYNIRWRSGHELREISKALTGDTLIGGAAIIGLQEVDRNKKRTGYTNTARALAEDLGMYYAWAAPPAAKSDKEEETGVAILSRYPLTNIERLVLPHEGPGGRRRAALGATVKIGEANIRVYSVHAETRIPVPGKLDQMRAVLDDLTHYPKTMPAIVLGDFNTWEVNAADETTKLFQDAGFTTPFDKEPTFLTKMLISIELKLDWIWLRGLEPVNHGIDRKIEVSDHWPLWTVVGIKAVGKSDLR
ncbi:MAG TPA: endonuclease/exonuclease/phosphatase family protein [Pyrinomonadaceae bacterium]